MEQITATEHETFRTIAVILCPILLGVLGWMIRATISKSEDSISTLSKSFIDLDKNYAIMQKDIQTINVAMMRINAMAESMQRIQEDVTILKRDQTTIWKRIDEIREDFKK